MKNNLYFAFWLCKFSQKGIYLNVIVISHYLALSHKVSSTCDHGMAKLNVNRLDESVNIIPLID